MLQFAARSGPGVWGAWRGFRYFETEALGAGHEGTNKSPIVSRLWSRTDGSQQTRAVGSPATDPNSSEWLLCLGVSHWSSLVMDGSWIFRVLESHPATTYLDGCCGRYRPVRPTRTFRHWVEPTRECGAGSPRVESTTGTGRPAQRSNTRMSAGPGAGLAGVCWCRLPYLAANCRSSHRKSDRLRGARGSCSQSTGRQNLQPHLIQAFRSPLFAEGWP